MINKKLVLILKSGATILKNPLNLKTSKTTSTSHSPLSIPNSKDLDSYSHFIKNHSKPQSSSNTMTIGQRDHTFVVSTLQSTQTPSSPSPPKAPTPKKVAPYPSISRFFAFLHLSPKPYLIRNTTAKALLILKN